LQNPLAQSVAAAHFFPSTHFPQLPPQSTSVSLAFLNPSLQLGAAHINIVGLQNPFAQSAATKQALPSTHFGHFAPPQSIAVSDPSFVPFEQPGPTQTPPVHKLVSQSSAVTQCRPAPHGAQRDPPQSKSVSSPFLSPSLQLGPSASGLVSTSVVTSGTDASPASPRSLPVPDASNPHPLHPAAARKTARSEPAATRERIEDRDEESTRLMRCPSRASRSRVAPQLLQARPLPARRCASSACA
jgi:hypothetical protein